MVKLSNRAVRRSAAEWRQLIDRQRDSGQSQASFCRAQGVSLGTFQHWKRRLRDDATSPGASPWLELPLGLKQPEGRWEIELELGGGVCLRLSRR